MSKGDSHLFSGTIGKGHVLIAEVIASGRKISPDKVKLITTDPSGRIVWIETGNRSSGVEHIIHGHGKQFNAHGISNEEIPNFVLEAVHQGNIVGTQGKRNPRTVYEVIYYGEHHRVAVQVGTNGYVVSANPKSMEE